MSNFNNILNTIKKISRGHEEPYREGAWEDFLDFRRKREKTPFWPIFLSGIAASLLIGILVFYHSGYRTFDPKPEIVDQVAKTDSLQNSDHSKQIKSVLPGPEKVGAELAVKDNSGTEEKSPALNPGNEVRNNKEPAKVNAELLVRSGAGPENTGIAANEEDKNLTKDTVRVPENRHNIVIPTISKNVKYRARETKTEGRIKLGFSVSPLLTSSGNGSNLGFSTGVHTDWKLTKNLSFSSGLFISHQTVVEKNEIQPSFNGPVSQKSKLFSIDIPLNIKIKIKQDNYFLAGISPVAYIGSNTIYNYQYQEVIETTYTQEGQVITQFETVTKETTVKNKAPVFSDISFAGFINVSYGIKYSLAGNTYITFAPYIKLPLGETNDNLQFTSGGVSFILSK
jgi:hypothetical protein